MPLKPEDIKELKKQLSEQIKHLPQEQRLEAQSQIDSMSPEALETMLLQQQNQSENIKDIYRAIISEKIPSKKIDENKQSLAVLEIKPISRGHVIIIPKEKVVSSKELPNQAFSLAKKVSKKIISKLKAKSTEIQTQFAFGEIIINIIPIYDKSVNLNSPRSEISEKQLDELYSLLRVIKKPKTIKVKKTQDKKVLVLKRRIA